MNGNAPALKVLFVFWAGLLNDNHPVLQAMRHQLQDLRQRYQHQPCEFNRYQLVRQEQRLAQLRPDLIGL